jgi:hypothetical protein
MTDFSPILRWYTGKALTVARDYVLPTLAEAETLGYWPKGASRKVAAALNKCNVAHKFARANERRDHGDGDAGRLNDVFDVRGGSYYKAKLSATNLIHAMMFGSTGHAPDCLVLADKLTPFCVNDTERTALATAREWAAAFAPVAELMERLDATRPKPVYVFKTLSPTVLTNVNAAMGLNLTTVREPETIWVKVERLAKDGTKFWTWAPKIIWPEGTVHNTSKFAYGTANNNTCHACGHAIKNAFNWVALLADNNGEPRSLWVGKDCARNLFGCKVDGEAEFTR